LNRLLLARGYSFHVHFMAFNHSDRPSKWSKKSEDFGFPNSFWEDFPIKGHYHFNPGLLRYLWLNETDYLLVGGPWDTITGFFSTFMARRKVGIGWYEANTASPGKISGPVAWIKRALLKKYEYFALPGNEGVKHLRSLLGEKNSPVKHVILPNIIDESKFSSREQLPTVVKKEIRDSFELRDDEKLALWPARLRPQKGIIEFLSVLEPEMLAGWKIVILGEGTLKEDVETLIRDRGLNSYVILRSYVGYEQMPNIYASSDLFLLPSIIDPNPLSVVEALFTGLPILVSNRIGNFSEALRPEKNGWGLDPNDEINVRKAVQAAFGASSETLAVMGRRSTEIARSFWSSEKSINSFLNMIEAR